MIKSNNNIKKEVEKYRIQIAEFKFSPNGAIKNDIPPMHPLIRRKWQERLINRKFFFFFKYE